jgi:F-type H+-transporting ATPase subunit b
MTVFASLIVAATEAAGTVVHEESAFSPANPEFWVYAGLTIFILLALVVGKAPKRITETLDQRIVETRRQLDEAKALRAEAERLLADAKARHDASAGDAAAIIAQAEEEAAAMLAKAEADADELVTRRAAMAEDKIHAAERQAIADVRTQAASAAAKAASHIIAAQHDAAADRTLVDRTIAGLSRLN